MTNSATANIPRNSSGQRFVFVDALRGVASLAVLFYHMLSHDPHVKETEPINGLVSRVLPGWVETLSSFGSNGVPIFFVLSGFVIAYSLRNNSLTGSAIKDFILRRQFRLDPPYWAMIFLGLLALKLEQMIPVLRTFPEVAPPPLPSPPVVLLNLFYVQNITHVQAVLGVAWTLCIEIQFYLVFIALLWLANWLSRDDPDRRVVLSTWIVLTTGICSLAFVTVSMKQTLFIQYWHSFAAGVLCYWALAARASRRDLGLYGCVFVLTVVVFALTHRKSASVGALSLGCACITTLALYAAGKRGGLTTWWNGRVLQYFGRISYSLYLVHIPVLAWTFHLGYRASGQNPSVGTAFWILAGVLSVAVAHVFYLGIEKPSIALAARFKRKYPAQPSALPLPDAAPVLPAP